MHYDCDPGQDDAVALLYALGSPSLKIDSISVVGGNVDVHQCARNALQILELAERSDIPVYIGAEKPLKRELVTLPEVFGETGMAGAEDLPLPVQTALSLSQDTPLQQIMRSRTVVATGPLTNLAQQILDSPDFAATIDHLYLMGGCVYPEPIHKKLGNIQPKGSDEYAEYNFFCDPDAAQIVFSAGITNITMVGLDVTRSALYGQDVDTALRALDKKCARKAADIFSAVGEEDHEDYASLKKSAADPVRAMHDVLSMAMIDRPELFTFETLPIRIVNEAPPAAAGQTLIDADQPDHPAVNVAVSIRQDAFLQAMVDNLSNLP